MTRQAIKAAALAIYRLRLPAIRRRLQQAEARRKAENRRIEKLVLIDEPAAARH